MTWLLFVVITWAKFIWNLSMCGQDSGHSCSSLKKLDSIVSFDLSLWHCSLIYTENIDPVVSFDLLMWPWPLMHTEKVDPVVSFDLLLWPWPIMYTKKVDPVFSVDILLWPDPYAIDQSLWWDTLSCFGYNFVNPS